MELNSHLCKYFCLTGTNGVGKATNIVSIYKGYEEILQISTWSCIQGDRINHATAERRKLIMVEHCVLA